MQNFHDHKLWQASFVALMDIHEYLPASDALIVAAQNVAAKIADALSRADRRVGRDLIYDAVGLVAVTRTQLAVEWGKGTVDDDTFRSIDNKYADLTNSLQSFK